MLNTIKSRLLDSGKRYKDYVVSKTLNDANIKADKEGTMSFAYLNNGRSDISSKTTFEAILNRERTSTSIWSDNKGSSYWTDTKVGDTIKFWSDNTVGSGQSVLVKVTGVNKIDMSKMTDAELEAWSKAEGWSFEQAKGRSRMNTKNKGIQIRYELLDPASGNAITSVTEEEIIDTKPTQSSTSVKLNEGEIQKLQGKLNVILFKNAVKSGDYEVDLENKEDEFRKLKESDYEKVKNETLGLYDKSEERSLDDLIESEYHKITKEGLNSYIDTFNLKSLFDEVYNPSLTISEWKSDIKIQKENLEKVLPELKNYNREISYSEK